MPDLFISLLKINLVLLLFAVAYYVILRRLTFYVINRFFLVFGILFATIYPFIDLTDFFHNQNQLHGVAPFVPSMNKQMNELVPANFIVNNWQFISLFFYLGVLLMAIRLGVQFASLYIMHRKSKPGAVANFKVRILNERVSPFSFWQTVYVNPSLHEERELHTILAHEDIHVKEWHSLDIILAELSVVFYWFNPGVWLMKKAVKENLEFITDAKILKQGVDKKTYQYSLLDMGNLTPAAAIVNNFNLSDLKRRIKMMNVRRSSHMTLGFYVLLLPVLLLVTLAFTVTKKEINQHFKPIKQVLVSANLINEEVAQTKPAVEKPRAKFSQKNALAVKDKTDTVKKLFIMIKSGEVETTFARLLSVKKEFVEQTAKNIAVGTAQQYSFDYPADSLIFDKDKSYKISNIKIGFKVKGEPLTEGQHVSTAPPSDVITVVGYATKKSTEVQHKKVVLRGIAIKKERDSIDYTLNGEKVTVKEIGKLKPDFIESINVQKGNHKNGKIDIITKK